MAGKTDTERQRQAGTRSGLADSYVHLKKLKSQGKVKEKLQGHVSKGRKEGGGRDVLRANPRVFSAG